MLKNKKERWRDGRPSWITLLKSAVNSLQAHIKDLAPFQMQFDRWKLFLIAPVSFPSFEKCDGKQRKCKYIKFSIRTEGKL